LVFKSGFSVYWSDDAELENLSLEDEMCFDYKVLLLSLIDMLVVQNVNEVNTLMREIVEEKLINNKLIAPIITTGVSKDDNNNNNNNIVIQPISTTSIDNNIVLAPTISTISSDDNNINHNAEPINIVDSSNNSNNSINNTTNTTTQKAKKLLRRNVTQFEPPIRPPSTRTTNNTLDSTQKSKFLASVDAIGGLPRYRKPYLETKIDTEIKPITKAKKRKYTPKAQQQRLLKEDQEDDYNEVIASKCLYILYM